MAEELQQILIGADQFPFPRHASKPRKRKRRKPRASWMQPKTGSTVACHLKLSFAYETLGPLKLHAVSSQAILAMLLESKAQESEYCVGNIWEELQKSPANPSLAEKQGLGRNIPPSSTTSSTRISAIDAGSGRMEESGSNSFSATDPVAPTQFLKQHTWDGSECPRSCKTAPLTIMKN